MFGLMQAKFVSGFDKAYYDLSPKAQRAVFITRLSQLFDRAFLKTSAELAFVRRYFSRAKKHFFRQDKDFKRLLLIRQKYRIKELYNLKEYEFKINKTPKSLGIAQAIVESATGTSRFARHANNLFGEWTWDGQGLIPKNRDKNKKHRIRVFDSLQNSVDSYVLNLNRHKAYYDFRKARAKLLEDGQEIGGLKALSYLHAYSELGKIYLKIIKKVIINEKLEKLDAINAKADKQFLKNHASLPY